MVQRFPHVFLGQPCAVGFLALAVVAALRHALCPNSAKSGLESHPYLCYAAFPAHGRPHRLYLRLDSPPYFSAASTDAARQSDFPSRPRRAKLSRRTLWFPLLPRVKRLRPGHALCPVFSRLENDGGYVHLGVATLPQSYVSRRPLSGRHSLGCDHRRSHSLYDLRSCAPAAPTASKLYESCLLAARRYRDLALLFHYPSLLIAAKSWLCALHKVSNRKRRLRPLALLSYFFENNRQRRHPSFRFSF